jgi:single-stranded DNA-specific DHH superfamily exonuclease
VEYIERLGPFGSGNPEVKLIARGLRLVSPPRLIGQKNDHLQLTVAAKNDLQAHMRPGGIMRAVAFRKAHWEKKLIDADSFDLLFEPIINRFNGNHTAEMIVHDIQIPE